MANSVLLFTTTNLATNPRLLKEILILANDYSLTVVMFKLGNWSDKKTQSIIQNSPELEKICFIRLDATRHSFITWLLFGICEKVARKLSQRILKCIEITALANTRRSFQIYIKCIKALDKPDLICAHNLGALYPAWRLSKKWDIPFIFDVEDYHPGEFIRHDPVNERMRRENLMKKLLPHAAAITSASPLISQYTMNLIGNHPRSQTILNSFLSKEFTAPKETIIEPKPLMLIWFSQKISFGRGLEQLFEAMKILANGTQNLDNYFLLTLIGDMDKKFEHEVINPLIDQIDSNLIRCLPPLPQNRLHHLLCDFDVGLAIELNDTDLNRKLCLTNKIIAYAQAGLYILATNTPAQTQFIEENAWMGTLSQQSSEDLKNTLLELVDRKRDIRAEKYIRFEKAKELGWEKEGQKLRTIVNGIF